MLMCRSRTNHRSRITSGTGRLYKQPTNTQRAPDMIRGLPLVSRAARAQTQAHI